MSLDHSSCLEAIRDRESFLVCVGRRGGGAGVHVPGSQRDLSGFSKLEDFKWIAFVLVGLCGFSVWSRSRGLEVSPTGF